MWLIELYDEVDLIAYLTVLAIVLELFFLVIIIIYINIMHLLLPHKLDSLLFNERWFSIGELGFYSTWPMSLFRTGIYMSLLSFPGYVKKRRFNGLEIELQIAVPLIIASRIYFVLNAFFILFGLSFVLLGLYSIIETWFF